MARLLLCQNERNRLGEILISGWRSLFGRQYYLQEPGKRLSDSRNIVDLGAKKIIFPNGIPLDYQLTLDDLSTSKQLFREWGWAWENLELGLKDITAWHNKYHDYL
jgi:hypothetical protein